MSYLIIVKELSLSYIEQLKNILLVTDLNLNTLDFVNNFVNNSIPIFVLWTFILLLIISTIYIQISKHFLIAGFWSKFVLNSPYRSFQVLDFFFFFV